MSVEGDVTITSETKKSLIFQSGWLTVLPIGIWYMFNFLFNVGALNFYGINSGYSSMKVEIDFFSLIFTGCFFLVYFVFLYDLMKERIKLYKVISFSSVFFISMVLLLVDITIGLILGSFLVFMFFFLVKKGFLTNLTIYKKNAIVVSFFLSLVMLSFYSGYFYSKRFSDYYCIESTIIDSNNTSKVLIARTDENTGIFVESPNIKINLFNTDEYELKSLIDLKLKKCDTAKIVLEKAK